MLYSRNLCEKSVYSDILPWDFQPTEELTAQLRHDKQTRQDWYQSVSVKHHFYSGLEGANPNQRVSKDNPPAFVREFCIDFDLKIPPARVAEFIEAVKLKPAYVERSLGGNVRLVWLLPRALPVESYEFCCYVLQKAIEWLSLDLLPGLDKNAFTDPSRLLCNGCNWEATGHGPIPEAELQAFFVACGKDYRFISSDPTVVPLDVVEPALRAKYPNFDWPGEFAEGTQGPSFWIEGSTSPMSAIVKKDGMFTFSAHAGKAFFSWGDLLGKEFVEGFSTQTIAKATDGIYWDSKRFWRKINGVYCSCDLSEFGNYLQVECKLSDKPDKSGVSPLKTALSHIYNAGRISGAAPHIFVPMGLIQYQGKPVLNTYVNRVMQPADELTEWGAAGKFPWLSNHFDLLFDPPEQKWYYFAWFKHYYGGAFFQRPIPGQNIVLMGPPKCGKTFTSRHIVAPAVGGFMDASEYMIKGGGFNSELLEVPHWAVDDETIAESPQAQTTFQAMVKKTNANQEHCYHKKFEVPTLVSWKGRVFITMNMDYVSSRTLGALDNSSLDKLNLFRCIQTPRYDFLEWYAQEEKVKQELPYYLRYVLETEPPDFIKRDVRYGFAAYHEARLLDQAHQGGRSAPFKEVLVDTLRQYFNDNPKSLFWRGSVTGLVRMMHTNPLNDSVLRTLKLEQTNRYLESIQREGILRVEAETGELKTRLWVFHRFEEPAVAKAPEPISSENSEKFNK